MALVPETLELFAEGLAAGPLLAMADGVTDGACAAGAAETFRGTIPIVAKAATSLQHLPGGELLKSAILGHEFIIGSGFDNFSFFQHQEAVGFSDSAQALGDHDARDVHLFEIIRDDRLGEIIEGTGGLIEDQNRRPVDQCARDDDALQLASRKVLPPSLMNVCMPMGNIRCRP